MDSCPKAFKLIWGQPSSPHHLRLMIVLKAVANLELHQNRDALICEVFYSSRIRPSSVERPRAHSGNLRLSCSYCRMVNRGTDQLSLIPCPVFALIPILLASEEYERHRQSTKVPLRLQRIQRPWGGARTSCREDAARWKELPLSSPWNQHGFQSPRQQLWED